MRQPKKKETTLNDVIDAVNSGFNQMEGRFSELENGLGELKSDFGELKNDFGELKCDVDNRFDRIEKIIDKWPPPSYVTDLLERVSKIEYHLKLKPKLHR